MPNALARYQSALFYGVLAALCLPVGILVARSESGVSLALMSVAGLAGIAILASLSARHLFLGWIVVAPLFQSSADATALGRTLTWMLLIGPALLMLALTIIQPAEGVKLSFVDALPAGYALYVVGSIAVTTTLLATNTFGTGKAFFLTVGIGVVAYYYLTLGPGSAVGTGAVLVALLAGSVIQGLLALIEYMTGWNLWGDSGWQGDILGGGRAVATLSNPALLGMFLGTGVTISVAMLTWNGPRSYRRVAWLALAVCVPALLATLTRGPILATAIAVTLLLVLGRARLVGFGVLAVAAIAVVLLLPSFKSTDLYRDRISDRTNVQFRQTIQDWSLRLAMQRPVFGWGYGSFDRVKNASGFTAQGVPIQQLLQYTSHDTYLTILVEYGSVGLILLLSPFVVLGFRAVARARAPGPHRWIAAATLASLVVVFVSASTFDARFFSFALTLTFVLLAILRRIAGDRPATAVS